MTITSLIKSSTQAIGAAFLLLSLSYSLAAQNLKLDTALANWYLSKADSIMATRASYDSAASYLSKASPLFKKNDRVLNYYQCEYKIAECLWRRGKLSESEDLCRVIIKEVEQGPVAYPSALSYSYYNLGIIYYQKAAYDQSIAYHLESLDIASKFPQVIHPSLAGSYNFLGLIYADKSDYEKSLEYYEKGLETRKRLLGNIHQDVAASHNNIGNLYADMSNYELAMDHYNEALMIRLRILGEEHLDVAHSYNNIGTTFNEQGHYDEAITYFQKSNAIRLKTLGQLDPLVAVDYNNIGTAYYFKGEYAKALEYLQKSLDLRLKTLGDTHRYTALSYSNIARVYQATGSFDKAITLYKQAGTIQENIFGITHPDYIRIQQYLASCYEAARMHADAAALYIDINEYFTDYLENMFRTMGELERERFYSPTRDYFEEFQNFAVQQGTIEPHLLSELLDLRLVNKSILLNTSSQIKRRITDSGDRVLIDLYDEVQALKQRMGLYYGMSKQDLTDQGITIDSIKDLLHDKDKQLSQYSSFYAEDRKTYQWTDIRDKLKPDEAAVEILRHRVFDFKAGRFMDSVVYVALVITPRSKSNPKLVVLPNGKLLEGQFVRGYRNRISFKMEDDTSYKNFWTPLQGALTGINKVFFSPDGVFNLINIETLFNSAKKRFLQDEVAIHQVTSLRDLLVEHVEPLRNRYAIVLGNPNFRETQTSSLTRAGSMDPESSQRVEISPLPGTQKEVESIASLFDKTGWRSLSLVGSDAREDKLKSMVKPKVLHIATHGFFHEDRDKTTYVTNPLFRSGLLFSGAQHSFNKNENKGNARNNNKEDGILTAFEAMNLNVDNTDLVVLSACETGLGEVRNGEGVYGLHRAFKVAGARTILVSLWKVDDNVTQELMTTFYGIWLAGKSKRDAFEQAQKMIRNKYPQPFYWGAFLMSGE